MIESLELDEFDEKHYDIGWISKIIDEFLDGKRYIFKLKSDEKSVRTLQIWDQMNQYLMENW